jgi:hypothetical protein
MVFLFLLFIVAYRVDSLQKLDPSQKRFIWKNRWCLNKSLLYLPKVIKSANWKDPSKVPIIGEIAIFFALFVCLIFGRQFAALSHVQVSKVHSLLRVMPLMPAVHALELLHSEFDDTNV